MNILIPFPTQESFTCARHYTLKQEEFEFVKSFLESPKKLSDIEEFWNRIFEKKNIETLWAKAVSDHIKYGDLFIYRVASSPQLEFPWDYDYEEDMSDWPAPILLDR